MYTTGCHLTSAGVMTFASWEYIVLGYAYYQTYTHLRDRRALQAGTRRKNNKEGKAAHKGNLYDKQTKNIRTMHNINKKDR